MINISSRWEAVEMVDISAQFISEKDIFGADREAVDGMFEVMTESMDAPEDVWFAWEAHENDSKGGVDWHLAAAYYELRTWALEGDRGIPDRKHRSELEKVGRWAATRFMDKGMGTSDDQLLAAAEIYDAVAIEWAENYARQAESRRLAEQATAPAR